jgi:hypothetical protein
MGNWQQNVENSTAEQTDNQKKECEIFFCLYLWFLYPSTSTSITSIQVLLNFTPKIDQLHTKEKKHSTRRKLMKHYQYQKYERMICNGMIRSWNNEIIIFRGIWWENHWSSNYNSFAGRKSNCWFFCPIYIKCNDTHYLAFFIAWVYVLYPVLYMAHFLPHGGHTRLPPSSCFVNFIETFKKVLRIKICILFLDPEFQEISICSQK